MISKLTQADQGFYTVEIKDSKDTVTCKTKLIVKGELMMTIRLIF